MKKMTKNARVAFETLHNVWLDETGEYYTEGDKHSEYGWMDVTEEMRNETIEALNAGNLDNCEFEDWKRRRPGKPWIIISAPRRGVSIKNLAR